MPIVKCDACGYEEEYRKGTMQFCRGDCIEKDGYSWLLRTDLPRVDSEVMKRIARGVIDKYGVK